MVDSFNEYLDEQKKANNYSSEYDLNEGFWSDVGNKIKDTAVNTAKDAKQFIKKDIDRTFGSKNEKKGWIVKIDFSDKKVINEVVEKLRARDEFKTSNALADKEKFFPAVSGEIAKYIKTLTELFSKNNGHLIVKPDGDKVLGYIFDNYTEKDPQNYAKEFVSSINHTEGDNNVRFLAEIAETSSYDYIKSEVKDNNIRNNNFNNVNSDVDTIAKDDFVVRLVNSIYKEVKETVDKNNQKAEQGELIKVYSIPFRVDDVTINKVAKDTKENGGNLDKFYENLTENINKTLKEFLGELDASGNLAAYIGFIPVKSYGFNLYFKDRGIAEEAAETLNQENGAKVTERMRYEKRIAKMPTVLEGKTTIGTTELHGPSEATKWFRNTKFAIDHVGELVNDVFPGADDQIKIKTARFEIKKEQRQQLGDSAKAILKNLAKKISDAMNNQKDFIVMSSSNNIIDAKFMPTATEDNIRTLLNGIFNVGNDIQIKNGVLTKNEIETYKSKFSAAMTNEKEFLELFGSLVGYNAEKGEEQNKEDSEAVAETLDSLMMQFKFDGISELDPEAKKKILAAVNNIKFSDSFTEAFKMNLYNYLMESLHLNEITEEDKKRLAAAKTPEEKSAIRKEIAGRASITEKEDEAKKPETKKPEAKKAGKGSPKTLKAKTAAKAKKIEVATSDLMEHPETITAEALLGLIAAKIENVMDMINIKKNSKIKVELDKSTQSITINYPNKAKELVVKYVKEIKDHLSKYVNIQG